MSELPSPPSSPRLAGPALVVVALVGVALTIAIGFLAGALVYVGMALDEKPGEPTEVRDFGYAAEYVDEETEAGYHPPILDASDPLLAQRKIVITTAINERSAREIAEKLFHLDSVAPGETIQLFLASPGGWLDSAYAIIDTIEAIESPVETHCIGGCYSAGSMILAAGTGTRSVTRNSLVMVHANLDDSSEPFSFERLSLERFERFYRQHAQLPEEWFPLVGESSYYLSPQEAVDYGLADLVVEPAGASASR